MFFVTPSSGLHNLLAKLKMLFCRRAKCVCFFVQLLITLMNPSRERIHIFMRLDQRSFLTLGPIQNFSKLAIVRKSRLEWVQCSIGQIFLPLPLSRSEAAGSAEPWLHQQSLLLRAYSATGNLIQTARLWILGRIICWPHPFDFKFTVKFCPKES